MKRGLVFIFLVLFLVGSVSATDFYVAKTGCSDSYSGTETQPWCTIQKAADTLQAGDTIYVKDGVYYEDTDIVRSGSSGNPITFMNYPGHNPVVDGSGISGTKLVRIAASYIIWDGIDVRDGADKGLYMNGDYGIIRNVEAYNNGHSGIFIDVGHNALIEYNEAHDNGWNGIDVMESNNVTIRYNKAYNQLNHMGIQCVSNHLESWPTGNKIYNNEVYNNINGIYWAHNINGKIYNNIIYENRDNGISFNYMSPVGAVTYNAYVEVYSNTIVDNNKGISNPLANYLTIKNNILVYNSDLDIRIAKTTGHSIDYNLYTTSSSYTWGGTTYSSLSSWQSATNQDANSIEADPLFMDPTNDDYSLQTNSPACGAGEGGSDIGAFPCSGSQTQNCTELGGSCCTTGQTCSGGSFQSASDCSSCCVGGTCTTSSNFQPEQLVEAEDGNIVSPMQIGSDSGASGESYVSTSSWYDGSVSFTFDIPTAGDYLIEARVLAPDGGGNSFYIGVDGEDANGNESYTWDTDIFSSFGWENVSLRGPTGTYNFSEFDPMVWSLSSGSHVFSFYGREPDTWLDSFVLREIVQSSCSSGADSDEDSVVSIVELLSFIGQWKTGGVSIVELLNGIGEWKNGC